MASHSSLKEATSGSIWRKRRELLPRLQARSQKLIDLILGDLLLSRDGEPLLPSNSRDWHREFYANRDDNELQDTIDLLSSMPRENFRFLFLGTADNYTMHNYIQLQEYNVNNTILFGDPQFPTEKVYKILYLANLGLLVINLFRITAQWERISPEERALSIRNISLVFPEHFLPPDSHRGTEDSQVMLELRTQIFTQTFLEAKQTDNLDQWNTNDKIAEIFKIDDMGKSTRESEQNVRPTYTQLTTVSEVIYNICKDEN
jgi:hypothetical protein